MLHAVGIHKPIPSPWGEGQGEGGEYKTLAILYRENRWQSAQIKRGGISLPLLLSTVSNGVYPVQFEALASQLSQASIPSPVVALTWIT